ncbi:MAG TPA: di-heme oxidoredictase family protein, partial [Terriglobia bacterium]
ISALSNVQANLFSDVLVHDMGSCTDADGHESADNVTQGQATGDQFRTALLWGVGQRYFFMHDGQTMNIVQAVEDHFCPASAQYPASEANGVVSAFNGLSAGNQQDLINFLRSL